MTIDTDKYEGHTLEYGMHCARLLEHLDTEPNRRLIADALPLLEEVKRLFEEVKRLREGRLDLINEVVRIINNKTGERVNADLHDYIIDRLVKE